MMNDSDDLLEQDAVQQFITRALSGLPWPASQPPGDLSAPTYLTFSEVRGSLYMAGNRVKRVRHMVQLHAWTQLDGDEHRTAFFEAIRRLRAAGARVYSWGPDEREKDTGISHIACTLTWTQRPEHNE